MPPESSKEPATLTLLTHLLSSSTTTQSKHQSNPKNYLQETAQTKKIAEIKEIHASQISHKTLHLRSSSPDPQSQTARSVRRKQRLSRRTRERKNQRPKPLSAREKRASRLYDLELRPQSASATQTSRKGSRLRRTVAEWRIWKGLWMLWCGYAREVLNLNLNPNSKSLTNPNITPNSNLSLASLGPKIASLDLHGALVRVVKSGCPSLVGCWGICVRECKFSLVLVDERCFVRRVGKRGVVFAVDIPVPVPASGSRSGSGSGSRSRGEGVVGFDEEEKGSDADVDVDVDVFRKGSENAGDDGGRIGRITIEISGSAIECRPVDRATKKFKGRKYDGF